MARCHRGHAHGAWRATRVRNGQRTGSIRATAPPPSLAEAGRPPQVMQLRSGRGRRGAQGDRPGEASPAESPVFHSPAAARCRLP
eukprot:CAMPEP_0182573318 /NCGR_PEP_ID=MMETSP1324-20130603/19419_1 /TAXON_ID=236786 /ORGANISM="Florenciella sp., Strain RCC1587" /LENGTH=84 /DNA_ID=CAMNT_0024788405 /DNA_START=32 /DNA_END=286 /DNA_ORIENTATION=+